MSQYEPMTCKCCGAPLSRYYGGWKCDYCGTQYAQVQKQEGPAELRIVRTSARVSHLKAKIHVPVKLVQMDPERASKFAASSIMEEFSDTIAKQMKLTAERSYDGDYVVQGEIGVVFPETYSSEIDWGTVKT